MDELIQALAILNKYENPKYPTGCEHEILYVYINPNKVSKEDIQTLNELGFKPSCNDEHFYSYRFGSA